MAFDEGGLTVEHVDRCVRDLTMDQQWHADPSHAGQNRIKTQQIGDTRR